jgi:hypothetical protein
MMYKNYAIVVHSGLLGWYCRYWRIDKVDPNSGIPLMEYQTPVGREIRQLAINDAVSAVDFIIRNENQAGQASPDPLDVAYNRLSADQFDEGSALALYDIACSLRRMTRLTAVAGSQGQGGPVRNPPPGAVVIARLLDDITRALTGMESHELASDLAFQVDSYKALITAAIVPKLREILESLK